MSSWLNTLRGTELHRLAVLLGTPCSGTKAVKIHGIQNALMQTRTALAPTRNARDPSDEKIRLLSIDMGVKNLAYAFLTASGATDTEPKPSSSPLVYTLEDWRKVDISESAAPTHAANTSSDSGDEAAETAHAYHPAVYAGRAYSFVQSVFQHSPTHIIIERQRFRSGGGAAVQEWSIRVGVFEAMLWSVLHTLKQRDTTKLSPKVESVLPARVNQFWLEHEHAKAKFEGIAPGSKTGKLSGKEMKKAKVNLAISLLETAGSLNTEGVPLLRIGGSKELQQRITDFTGDPTKNLKSDAHSVSKRVMSATRLTKLDDLADCLLQGIAWVNWRNNRIKVIKRGQDAFNLESGQMR